MYYFFNISKSNEREELGVLATAELASTFPNKIVTGYDRLWSIETGFL